MDSVESNFTPESTDRMITDPCELRSAIDRELDRLDLNQRIVSKQIGADSSMLSKVLVGLLDGHWPKSDRTVALLKNLVARLGIQCIVPDAELGSKSWPAPYHHPKGMRFKQPASEEPPSKDEGLSKSTS